MYIMYADESGDTGLVRSPTAHFALASVVVHERHWRDFITALIAFRKTLRVTYGLPLRVEIHAAEFIRHEPVPGMPRHVRLAILRNFIDELAKLPYLSVTSVVIDKAGKPAGYDVFERGWLTLFQRFENTMLYGNFPGGHRVDSGIVITDNTDGMKLQKLVRKMAVYNSIPNIQNIYGSGSRNIPIVKIIEDPNSRDSKYSYLVQACDTVAYFLRQLLVPNRYIHQSGAQFYYDRLGPILNTKASRTNRRGIVML